METTGPRAGSSAPLALFVFRRYESTLRVLDALAKCYEFSSTPVTIYSDAGRSSVEQQQVERLREALRPRLPPNAQLVERKENFGLAASVIDGVGDLVSRYGRAIVIEDDLLPAPPFLAWFNAALDRFQDEPRVMQVAAHMFDVAPIRRAGRGVFLQHPTSKGWAVWQRSWNRFDPECLDWQAKLADPGFRARFRVRGAMRFEEMLRRQMAGRLSSWAIRFHYAVAKSDGLVLYPPMSLVEDVGRLAGQATHGQRSAGLLPPATVWPYPEVPALPGEVAADDWAIKAWADRIHRSPFALARTAAAVRDIVASTLPLPKPPR